MEGREEEETGREKEKQRREEEGAGEKRVETQVTQTSPNHQDTSMQFCKPPY